MVLKFSELKELVNKLEKRIPKYKQKDTCIEVILSNLDNNSTKVKAEGFVVNIKMNYCRRKSSVIIKQEIIDDPSLKYGYLRWNLDCEDVKEDIGTEFNAIKYFAFKPRLYSQNGNLADIQVR